MTKNQNKQCKENKNIVKNNPFLKCKKRRKQKEIIDGILKTLATSNEPMTTTDIAEKNGLNTVSCRRYLEMLEFAEKVSRFKRSEYWSLWKIR